MAYRKQPQPPSRGPPPPQQLGPMNIVAITNCFNIDRLPVRDFVQWDAFSPEVKIQSKREELVYKLQNDYPNVFHPKGLYDGNKIMLFWHNVNIHGGSGRYDVRLSNGPLPSAEDVGKKGVYSITLTRTSGDPIRLSDALRLVRQDPGSPDSLRAINALQLLIRQTTHQNYTKNKKAFFSPVGRKVVGGGFEFWRGFFQSVRPTNQGLVVNVDTVMGVMFQGGPLINSALSVLRKENVRELDLEERHPMFRVLRSYMRGLKIMVNTERTGGRVRTIRDLVPRAGFFEFVLDKTGAKTTVQAYYASLNTFLQYPHIVGVNLAGINSSPVIIPLELCEVIPGQLYRKKIPKELTSEAVDFSTLQPPKRRAMISGTGDQGPANNLMQSPVLGYRQSEHMLGVGMEVSTEPLSISGQILPAPSIRYAGTKQASINNGAWKLEGLALPEPRSLLRWAVLCVTESITRAEAVKSMNSLAGKCRVLEVQDPGLIVSGNPHSVERHLDDIRNKAPPDLQIIVVIFPDRGDDIRARVKHWGDVCHGVRTQCLLEGKVKVAKASYWENVALKINARLGGSNSRVTSKALGELLRVPTMVVGADVGHAGPHSMRPSVTSLAWSCNQFASQYVAYTRVQDPRQEIIQDMREMMKDAVCAFNQQEKPRTVKQILFYRDGVSEGEFETVANNEVKEIKAAIDDAWETLGIPDSVAKPLLTFIVCGKRHHLLFFPDRQDQGDRNGNLHAGFVTDNRQGSVASPKENDFYLQSHAAIKGTSRSAHYTVLHKDSQFPTVDQLKDISYALCHVYAKATRSISIPAPIYYADMVCSRENFHYSMADRAALDAAASDAGSGNHQTPFLLQPWTDGFRGVAEGLKRQMYFL